VDGQERQSASNDVELGGGISATLQKVTDEPVTVGVQADSKDITNAVYEMVNGFNQLRETAVDAGTDKGAQALRDRLDSLAGAYGTTLSKIGITTNDDGYLQIDKEKFQKSIESGQAENALNGDSGFSRSLSAIATQAETSPERFLSYETRTQASQDDYYSSRGGGYGYDLSGVNFSASQNARIQQWGNVGMLLNMWG
jgi:flagellar capping protein FliD